MLGIRVFIGHMRPLFRAMIGDLLPTYPDSEFVDADIAPDASMIGWLREIIVKLQIDVLGVHTLYIDGWPDMIASLVAPNPIDVITINKDGGVGALYHLERVPIDFAAKDRRALIDAIQAAGLGAT